VVPEHALPGEAIQFSALPALRATLGQVVWKLTTVPPWKKAYTPEYGPESRGSVWFVREASVSSREDSRRESPR
jgi:hypothetical protein